MAERGLHHLIYSREIDEVKRQVELCSYGTAANVKGSGQWACHTPMSMAVLYCPELIRFLVEHGGNLRSRDSEESTLLHSAAYMGNLESVKILAELVPGSIKSRARNVYRRPNGYPSEVAQRYGHLEVADWLRAREDEDAEAAGTDDGVAVATAVATPLGEGGGHLEEALVVPATDIPPKILEYLRESEIDITDAETLTKLAPIIAESGEEEGCTSTEGFKLEIKHQHPLPCASSDRSDPTSRAGGPLTRPRGRGSGDHPETRGYAPTREKKVPPEGPGEGEAAEAGLVELRALRACTVLRGT